MKKKPDTMAAVVILFLVGLAVTGFSSMSVGSDENRQLDTPVSVQDHFSKS